MSSFSYAADLPLARDVVASLAAVEAELSDVVVDLRWRVALLHSIWTGASAAAHLEAHVSWEASYREMHEALAAMRSVVRTASEAYAEASSSNVANWNQAR